MTNQVHNTPRRPYPKPVRRAPSTVLVALSTLLVILLIAFWTRGDDPSAVSPKDNSLQTKSKPTPPSPLTQL